MRKSFSSCTSSPTVTTLDLRQSVLQRRLTARLATRRLNGPQSNVVLLSSMVFLLKLIKRAKSSLLRQKTLSSDEFMTCDDMSYYAMRCASSRH